jgi:phosphate transport system substrate-binding protein
MASEPQRLLNLTCALAVLIPAIVAGCTTPPGAEIVAPGGTSPSGGVKYCDQFASQSKMSVVQDGSSTVFPIAEAWADDFGSCLNLDMSVSFSGTGAGFQKFCRKEIQISDASRPIKDSERADCIRNGIDPFEVQVAIDGLAVVVSKDNTFVDYLSVTELNKIWTAVATKQANKWSDLRPGWPSQTIVLYGPGTNSGTFDYFVEAIIHPFDGSTGANAKGRNDYTPSEDDNILVSGVASSQYALGYFGLAYVEHNKDEIRAVPIKQDTADGGKTTLADAQPVEPNAQTVEAGKYKPLARPLFMYTDQKPTGRVLEYFKLGLTEQGQKLVEEVGYIKLPAAKQTEVLQRLE